MIDVSKRPVEDATGTDGNDDDSFVHRFCQCSDKIALCGKSKENWEDVKNCNPSEMCIVCQHLHLARHCPKCATKP